ncbi:MAG: hypothetical protein JXR05_06070 [Flavobacteriaceae bacterium]
MLVCFCSCDYFSFQKNKPQEKLDTNVDYKAVDTPPSFEACKNLIDQEKIDCFRKMMHQEIAKSLSSQDIKVKRPVDETIHVIITISSEGKATLKSIKASDNLYQEIPKLKQMLEKSIVGLPIIYPAIKRGITVTSEYTMPIKIKLEN